MQGVLDFSKTPIQKIALSLALVTLLILPLFLKNEPYLLHVFIMTFVYLSLGQAWNLIGGYAGQLSFANHIFFALGAYTSTMLLLRLDLTPWVGSLAGMIVAALVAYLLGFQLFHLKGHYFAVATIAFTEMIKIVFLNWRGVGAAYGLSLPLKIPSFYFLMWRSKVPYYYIFFAVAVFSTLLLYLIDRHKSGMYFRSIKQDEEGAEQKGIDTRYYKLLAFMLSAVICALVGTLYAQYVLYIDPRSTMDIMISIKSILIVLFGGLGNVLGPVLGAAILVPLGEFTRVKLGGGGQGWDYIIYGLFILMIILYQPKGIYDLLRRRPKYV
jgi:branched-chain amino acid transport system permease protein